MSKEPTLCLSRRRGTACTFTHVLVSTFVCDCGMPHARMGPGCRNRRRGLSLFGPACPFWRRRDTIRDLFSSFGLSCLSAVCIDRAIYLHYRL